ncbi:thrombopoietin receptor isoform X2 [Amia ocellicauda]|uniref:thrombopoietin receptor isoform X2 n=1 Tax=Amia ocellicauda TaxID=2972642 RepID=UPI003463F177
MSIWVPAWVCWEILLASALEPISPLLKEAIALVADDENPKCFTQTEEDFTCFWEDNSNSSYKFYYKIDELETEKECVVSQRRTDRGSTLHLCSFPEQHVFLYVQTYIRVVDSSTNATAYSREVNVENQILLDQLKTISLVLNGKPRQLRVFWTRPAEWSRQWTPQYQIRHSPASSGLETGQVNESKSTVYDLVGLSPGQEYRVQVRARLSDNKFWSTWSPPVSTAAPSPAEDIDLRCYTADLLNIMCQWSDAKGQGDTRYKLFYQHSGRGLNWEECVQNETDALGSATRCSFPCGGPGDITVSLNASSGQHTHTYYTLPLSRARVVRTEPPASLMGKVIGGRLWLSWEPPLAQLAAHLRYEIRFSAQDNPHWKHFTLELPKNSTVLDVAGGNQYNIQIRAMVDGQTYDGFWSDWSDSITVAMPSPVGFLPILIISLVMLLTTIVLIATFPKCLRKTKLFLWPPVPNLEKVLEGFLTELNKQFLPAQSFNSKICNDDDFPPSRVEIVSEREAQEGARTPGEQRQSPPGQEPASPPPSDGKPASHFKDNLESSEDYVVLDTQNLSRGFHGNEYVYEEDQQAALAQLLPGGEDGPCQPCLHWPESSLPNPPSPTDILNHSYLLLSESLSNMLAELEIWGTATQYTNLDTGAVANTE